ncbi:MAG: hypothetical protein HUU15_06055 [Candidatus Brocadiae bacterium]|nr:hypothetical protein [Candidatus Brocadiia bacterium]
MKTRALPFLLACSLFAAADNPWYPAADGARWSYDYTRVESTPEGETRVTGTVSVVCRPHTDKEGPGWSYTFTVQVPDAEDRTSALIVSPVGTVVSCRRAAAPSWFPSPDFTHADDPSPDHAVRRGPARAESVTTPAGTFDTLYFHAADGKGGWSHRTETWFARDTGAVRIVLTETDTRAGRIVVETLALVKYEAAAEPR